MNQLQLSFRGAWSVKEAEELAWTQPVVFYSLPLFLTCRIGHHVWRNSENVGEQTSMLKKIGIGLGVLAGCLVMFLAVAAMQPSHYRIVRSTTINAPGDVTFAQVNDFHNWDAWSPWLELDPNSKNTFEGPTQGEGAVFKWSGNDKVGEGSMKILESVPNERIRIALAFVRPFQDASYVQFDLKPQEEKTEVSWSMEGEKKTVMHKAMCMVMNMEKMLGGDFEKGLAKMRFAAENAAKNAEHSEPKSDPTNTEGAKS